MNPKFALVGLGFIAQRHIDSIDCVGGELILTCDIDESKAKKVPTAKFHNRVESMLDDPLMELADYVVIATPNHLHVPIAKAALARGKKVLCEKPLCITTTDHAQMLKVQKDLFIVMQLRENKKLQDIARLMQVSGERKMVKLEILINREAFYFKGWKNVWESSGGLLFNIGVHYFDILTWFFGAHRNAYCTAESHKRMFGTIHFDHTFVDWEIALDAPVDNQVRMLTIDRMPIPLNNGLEMLHRDVYQNLVHGKGVRPMDVVNTFNLIQELNEKGEVKRLYV